MHKLKFLPISIILVMALLLAGPSFGVSASPLAQLAPTLGVADSFSILAATLISDANPAATTITGDVGSTGGGAAIGIPCTSMLGGTIYSVDAAPIDTCVVNNSAVSGQAQAANTAAFGALIAGVNSTCTTIPVELGGQTLVPGVYCSGGVFQLTSGVLALTGTGTWIFQSASTLTTAAGGTMTGGDPCSVWWRLPSTGTAATLGTGTQLTGNILAMGAIAIQTGATLNGRAFSQNSAVTLDGNTIIRGGLCTGGGGEEEEDNSVNRLPNTGGAPLRTEDFPWSVVIVGVISAIALALGVRAYRRTHLPKG